MDAVPSEQVNPLERLQTAEIEIRAKSIPSERHPDRDEDAIFILPERQAFGVFDGMGGYKGGEIASRIARDHVGKSLEKLPDGLLLEQTQSFLSSILKEAHEKILQQARSDPALKEMGTTASIVKVWEGPQGERKAVIGNVGDSRVYIRHADGLLKQVTLDDNEIRQMMIRQIINANEARALQSKLNNVTNLSTLNPRERDLYKNRNVIAQALGHANISPRIQVVDIRVGDKLIVTSDGIHDNLTDTEISKILLLSLNNQNAVENLIESSKERSRDANHPRSKPDDMSAIVAEIKSKSLPLNQLKVIDRPKQEAGVGNARDFTQLFKAIDEKGKIQGTQQTFDPAQLKHLINDVRSGKESIDGITRSGGLREQVAALIAVDRIRAALKTPVSNDK